MRATFAASSKPVFVVSSLPEPGRFALETEPPKQPNWEHCREQFAGKIDGTINGFFFSHGPNQGENVAGFMAKTEEILELPARSRYFFTDKDFAMWFEPADFWKPCDMRRSLMTLFLRCGMWYDPEKDNYEQALFGDVTITGDKAREYSQATRLAIMRFLYGFTTFVRPKEMPLPMPGLQKNGWVEVFRGKSIKEIKTLLVAEQPVFFGVLGTDAIWA